MCKDNKVNKVDWFISDCGIEYLIIPKHCIKNITSKLQGAMIIETEPQYDTEGDNVQVN